MELGVRSPKTLPKALRLLERLLAYAQQERADKAARRSFWEELRSLLLELPHTEHLALVKQLATTLPPALRPKFKSSDSEPAGSDAAPAPASA